MNLLCPFITMLLVNSLRSKPPTVEKCDKVSDELSAQGVTFEEKFYLNIMNANDAMCVYASNDGTVSSCCNQVTERLLAETAAREYHQIFLGEMNTLSESLRRIQIHLINISMQSVAEFGARLGTLSPRIPNSNETIANRSGTIRRLVSTMNSFVYSATPENLAFSRVKEYINQYIRTFAFIDCRSNYSHRDIVGQERTRRHWRHIYSKDSSSSTAFQQSKIDRDVGKALHTLMRGLNVTKLFLKMFNISLDIVTHISKCRECTISEECSTNVMRMNHCSYCAGEVLSRPCFSVCLQVISGCIWRLQTLSNDWKALFELTEKYFSKKRNQERLLKGLMDGQRGIRASIVRLYGDHIKECFVYPMAQHPMAEALRKNTRNAAAHFSYEARQMKVFWENLAVTMCTRSAWFSSLSDSSKCWNGSSITSPQWHKCTFCQDKRIRQNQVPKTVTHGLREIVSISADLTWLISSITKLSQKNLQVLPTNMRDNFIFKHSDFSVKSKEEVLRKNKTKLNKASWKELTKHSFIIFDDADSSNNGEEGSGTNMVSVRDNVDNKTLTRVGHTPQSLHATRSMAETQVSISATIIVAYLSLFGVILEIIENP